jgi:phosphoglycerate dehydrogenase-like enzyme
MKTLIHVSWPVKAWSIPDAQVAVLRERFPRIEFVHAATREEARELIVDVDTTLTPALTPDMVARSTRLRWVHSPAAAVEGLLPLAELAARNITITNSRGVQAVPIAEHVMGGLLVLSRKFNRTLAAQRDRQWIQNDLVDDWPWLLAGRHMTIVGLGTIGIEIARRAHACGMTVTVVRRRPTEPRPQTVARVLGPDQLSDALGGCDVLVLCAPGVAATQGMIGPEQLAMLNPGAVLINVARAQIVDGGALEHALATGRLGGAVLDVFEKEPLPESSPLWSMRNVVITPHSSGFRATHWDDVVDMYSENLRRYERGEELQNVIDPRAGY